jgi:Ran GTPase-activating protein (RanGAP) involved in mRNA processing and transport
MAKALFPLMTSAAGGERSFNVYGSTHTKKRNRLGAAKLDSLVRVKVNTKKLKHVLSFAREQRTLDTLKYFFTRDSTDLDAVDDEEDEEEEEADEEEADEEVEEQEEADSGPPSDSDSGSPGQS